MTPRRVGTAEAVEHLRAVAAAHAARTVWIGIDGCGGAGKTAFAARLAAVLPGAHVVHVDDFAGPGVAEWDWDRFGAQLREPLLAGRPARYQRWEWGRDTGGEWVDVPPGVPVVVEGVSSTRAEAGVPWDAQVWVDAPRELRLRRALERDGPAMLARWLQDWMPSEQRYLAREHPQDRVDLIVPGTD